MSLKAASDGPVNLIGKFMLFAQLGGLHMRVYFGGLDNFYLPLLFYISLIDRFYKGTLPTGRRMVIVLSHSDDVFSE